MRLAIEQVIVLLDQVRTALVDVQATLTQVSKTMREAIEPVKKKVTLAEIKADPKFKEMKLVRQSRLSVAEIRPVEWNKITSLAKA